MNRAVVIRRGIRAGVVPLGLGLILAQGQFRRGDIAEAGLIGLVALYVVGALALGMIGLGVWVWNLLDLIGVPAGSPVSCPRCGGRGTIRDE